MPYLVHIIYRMFSRYLVFNNSYILNSGNIPMTEWKWQICSKIFQWQICSKRYSKWWSTWDIILKRTGKHLFLCGGPWWWHVPSSRSLNQGWDPLLLRGDHNGIQTVWLEIGSFWLWFLDSTSCLIPLTCNCINMQITCWDIFLDPHALLERRDPSSGTILQQEGDGSWAFPWNGLALSVLFFMHHNSPNPLHGAKGQAQANMSSPGRFGVQNETKENKQTKPLKMSGICLKVLWAAGLLWPCDTNRPLLAAFLVYSLLFPFLTVSFPFWGGGR